jgi:hypothetical protein
LNAIENAIEEESGRQLLAASFFSQLHPGMPLEYVTYFFRLASTTGENTIQNVLPYLVRTYKKEERIQLELEMLRHLIKDGRNPEMMKLFEIYPTLTSDLKNTEVCVNFPKDRNVIKGTIGDTWKSLEVRGGTTKRLTIESLAVLAYLLFMNSECGQDYYESAMFLIEKTKENKTTRVNVMEPFALLRYMDQHYKIVPPADERIGKLIDVMGVGPVSMNDFKDFVVSNTMSCYLVSGIVFEKKFLLEFWEYRDILLVLPEDLLYNMHLAISVGLVNAKAYSNFKEHEFTDFYKILHECNLRIWQGVNANRDLTTKEEKFVDVCRPFMRNDQFKNYLKNKLAKK